MGLFTTRSNPFDEAWRAGDSPYRGTLGPNKEFASDPASFRNGFVASLRDNPKFDNFVNEGTFSSETAQRSQDKIIKRPKTFGQILKIQRIINLLMISSVNTRKVLCVG